MSVPGRSPFQYVSFHDRLEHVNIDLSRDSRSRWGSDRLQVAGLEPPASVFAAATSGQPSVSSTSTVQSTAFGTALQEWNELNLSLPFQAFYERVAPMSRSLVLLLHHRDAVVQTIDAALTFQTPQSWLAWDALLDLVPRFALDLGPEFLPVYPTCLNALLRASSLLDKDITQGDEALAAQLVERAFHSAAWILRAVLPMMQRASSPALLLQSWHTMRAYFAEGPQSLQAPRTTEEDEADDAPTVRVTPKSHTRRFASETLAHLVRKAPASQLDALAAQMLADALDGSDALERCVASTWAYACESVSRTLQSRTPALLEVLLRREAPSEAQQDLLVRTGERVLVALAHHANAAPFTPVMQQLLGWGHEALAAFRTGDDAALCAALRWLVAAAGTRKGKRVSDEVKPALFSLLQELVAAAPWTPAQGEALRWICTLLVVGVPLGRVQELSGPGSALLAALAAEAQESDAVHFPVVWTALDAVLCTLADGTWDGFRAFALPRVLELTTALLADGVPADRGDAAMALLAELEARGLLAHVVEAPPTTAVLRWSKGVRRAVQRRLGAFGGAIREKRDPLAGVAAVRLTPLFPQSAPVLLREMVAVVEPLAARSDEPEMRPVLGALLDAIAGTLQAAGKKSDAGEQAGALFRTPDAVERMLRLGASSRAVLLPLARLLHALKVPFPQETLPVLQRVLLEADRDMVHAALQILAQAHAAAPCNVFPLLLDTEETPLDVANVTSRNVKLRHAQREAFRGLPADDPQLQALILYALGTLKLNLKPIWKESRNTLVELATRCGEAVWSASFAELEAVDAEVDARVAAPSAGGGAVAIDAAHAAASPLEDPHLAQRIEALAALLQFDSPAPHTARTERALTGATHSPHRFAAAHYRAELLALYEQHPVLAERHSRAFVEFTLRKWPALVDRFDTARAPVAERNAMLQRLLAVYVRFNNLRGMHAAGAMEAHFLALCASPELALQRGALDCLLGWRHAYLQPHDERLHALLEPARFRDALSKLDLSRESPLFPEATRAPAMQVVVRLLFGLMISRRALRTSGSGGQHVRRAAILAQLYEARDEEMALLVDLMLEPFEGQQGVEKHGTFEVAPSAPEASPRRQLGLLALLAEVLRQLGPRLAADAPRLLGTTLSVTVHAGRALDAAPAEDVPLRSVLRDVRQTGVRRVAEFVRYAPVAWAPYREAVLAHLVRPRLATLATDSVQAPSALLELVRSWSTRAEPLLLFGSDAAVLPSVFACLANVGIKPAVANLVLDIVDGLLAHAGAAAGAPDAPAPAETAAAVRTQILAPNVTPLLHNLLPLVQHTVDNTFAAPLAPPARTTLLRRQVDVLAALAPQVRAERDADATVQLLIPLIQQRVRVVPERVKEELLGVLATLLPLAQLGRDPGAPAFRALYTVLSRLGGELRSRGARTRQAAAVAQLAAADTALERVAALLVDLNAFSKRMLEEPDFDVRLGAFERVLDSSTVFSADEWLALVYQALFFVNDADELLLRTNAGSMLQRLVRDAASDAALRPLVYDVLLPGVQRRLSSGSEAVRRELVAVLGQAVEQLGAVDPALGEQRALLAEGEEEASFFANIYHIQAHRRIRALHRLADVGESGAMRSRTISDVYLPLVWHFFEPGASGAIDMNMANEAVACTRRMCTQLTWGEYRRWFGRFLREMGVHTAKDATTPAERLHIRGVVALLEAFHFDVSGEAPGEAAEAAAEADADQVPDEEMPPAEPAAPVEPAVPSAAPLAGVLDMLPPIYAALNTKDDDRLPGRLPLAVGASRVALFLPEDRRRVELFKLFTALAVALRSKLQSTRDAARDTVVQELRAVGVSYLPELVHELRRTLTRGTQRSVCAYTLHSLLAVLGAAEPGAPLTSVDAALPEIAAAAVEDAFGDLSEDREADEPLPRLREVRQSKSLDTLELLARLSVPSRLQELLLPLRDVMATTENVRTLRNVEEALRRIATGISGNTNLDAGTLLVLCHTLIARGGSVFSRARQPAQRRGKTPVDEKVAASQARYAAPGRRRDVELGGERDYFVQNAHMFVALGLDVLTTALRRSRFDMHDSDTVGKLVPLVGAVGETLYTRHASVVERGLRATAALARCPLPNLAEALPVLVRQMLALLRHAGGLHSAVAQGALRALAGILRECRAYVPQEQQLTELLRLVAPEVSDPEAQACVFALLRAVVARAFVVPEMYDVMDTVAELLVTSADAQVRDVCRSLFLQFLLDYPQGKGRLQNQLHFLAKNLAYPGESGRLSVLELLGAVLTKFSPEVVRQHAELFFVALVMDLANDESTTCKQRAAGLIRVLLGVLEAEQLRKLVRMVHAWARGDNEALQAVALRVYDLLLASRPADVDMWAAGALEAAGQVVRAAADAALAEDQDLDEAAWAAVYHALQTLQALVQRDAQRAQRVLGDDAGECVVVLLTYPHAWCRVAACRVLGAFYAAVGVAGSSPLVAPAALVRAARQLVHQLYSPLLDDALALQVVRNLVYIGRRMAEGTSDGDELAEEEAELAAGESSDDGDEEADEGEEADEADTFVTENVAGDLPHGIDEGATHAASTGDAAETQLPSRPLGWLFSRLSRAARLETGRGKDGTGAASQRVSAAIKWFAAMIKHLDAPRLEPYLVHTIVPLHRLSEQGSGAPEELAALATEVLDMLRDKVGTTAFTRAYNQVQQHTATKRRERKTARLLEGIRDPEMAARRRAARNSAKHKSRKRKHAAYRDTKVHRVPQKRQRPT